MSEPVNGASKQSEQSERSEAERCGASERSERCERTNVASDRVARSKRDCHEKKQALTVADRWAGAENLENRLNPTDQRTESDQKWLVESRD